MPLKCGLEKTLESPLDSKEIKPINSKENQPWIFIGWSDAESEVPIFGHLMWRADSFEKTLILGKIEGRRRRGQRGWDGWMASPTQWTWVWVNSRSWWRTGRPGVLRFMGSQRVRHDWATELNGLLWETAVSWPRKELFKIGEIWEHLCVFGKKPEKGKN